MLKESAPIGELYLKTFEKINTDKVEVRELSQDMHKDYISNLHKAAESGIKKYKGDFYIQVLNKSENLITTVIRNYFVSRQTCPTPNYDQTVYRFNRSSSEIEFLWVVPSKKEVNRLYALRLDLNARRDLLMPFAVDFIDGKLYELALKLNKEI